MPSFTRRLLLRSSLIGAALGRSTWAAAPKLRVAAASDLVHFLKRLIEQSRATDSDEEIETSYGASGLLLAQILQRAPFDVFLTADHQLVVRLHEAGLIKKADLFRFANGRLALWARNDAGLDLAKQGLDALRQPSVKKIAIANPRFAPYGRAAQQVLQRQGWLEELQPKLVLGENVAQAAQFVDSGAALVGIISLSLAKAPTMLQNGRHWLIPGDLHLPIEHGGGILQRTQLRPLAERFRTRFLDPSGRKLLREFGYEPVGDS